MRIAILANNPNLYSNRRLMEAAQARGHEACFVPIRRCYMDITAQKPEIHLRGGGVLDRFDAVIPRIRPSLTFYGTAVLRQFQVQGAYCLNGPITIARAQDKLRTLQILSASHVDIPKTGFATSPQDTQAVLSIVGGAPVVIKLLEGTQGRGVVLAETDKAAESVVNAFKATKALILVQEFVAESRGVDIRCFVVGGRVVAVMERRAAKGEFRANIHLGGTGHKTTITPQERKMAVAAAKAVGLIVCGVDMIRSASGPKVLEVNASPGLEGVERTTGLDIAGAMVGHIERQVAAGRRTPSPSTVGGGQGAAHG